MEIQEAIDIVHATSYKPGFRFSARVEQEYMEWDLINDKPKIYFIIIGTMMVPNVTSSKQELIPVQNVQRVDVDSIVTENKEYIQYLVFKMIRLLELHELDEWLKWDGQHYRSPHV